MFRKSFKSFNRGVWKKLKEGISEEDGKEKTFRKKAQTISFSTKDYLMILTTTASFGLFFLLMIEPKSETSVSEMESSLNVTDKTFQSHRVFKLKSTLDLSRPSDSN